MLSLLREGFWRDIGLLVLTGIVVGALLASGAARISDTYFGTTVDGIIGRFGEYDLIVHVREEFKEQAGREISRIIQAEYPGARVEPSVSVAGRANFLIALPDKMRTQRNLEALSRAFWNIPGASGSTFIIEPRAVVSGVEPGAASFLMDQINKIDGVRFCFRDGASIGVVTWSLEDLPKVTAEIRGLLHRYRILDLRLPMGQEFADAPAVGAELVETLRRHSHGLVKDITSYGRNSDLKDLMATLAEMKKFLQYYAAKATITTGQGVTLKPGDTVILRSHGTASELEVEIREVNGSRATGMVIAGDVQEAVNSPSFAVYGTGDRKDARLGTATVTSERQRLTEAVNQGIALVKELEVTASHGADALSGARRTIEMYDDVLSQLVAAQRALETFRDGIVGGRPPGKEPARDKDLLKDRLDRAVGIVERFASSLETLDFLDRQLSEFIPQEPGPGLSRNASALVRALTAWRDRARSLSRSLGAVSDLAETGALPGVVSGVLDATNRLLVELQNADIGSLKQSLDRMSSDLNKLRELDTSAMLSQLESIKKSLPNIRDEQVGHSVKLIESYMGGQVIPGERIGILIGPEIRERDALMAAREATRGFDVAVNLVPPGMLEPGLRSEVYRVMKEARSAIATLVALVFAFLSLFIDHSSIASSIRCFGRGRKRPWRLQLEPALYMTGTGAILTSGIYLVSGTRFSWITPYQMAALGGLMGLMLSAISHRINPVNAGEVEACEAIGMPYSSIMREIIIPDARPGILQLINRVNVRYSGRPRENHAVSLNRAGGSRWPRVQQAGQAGGGSRGIAG
ncbi:MAG TPA: hypothetical protein GX506_10945 [Firmicutes bacterium]|nr:hypothetical protein [Bacillota bacterium]